MFGSGTGRMISKIVRSARCMAHRVVSRPSSIGGLFGDTDTVDFLEKMSLRIINENPGISRVTYDISSKPPATNERE